MKTTRATLHLISLLPIAALMAVSCADLGDPDALEGLGAAPVGARAPQVGEEGSRSRAHLMAMPRIGVRVRAATPAESAGEGLDAWGGQGSYNFTYRGGPVISHVKVVTVFWNGTVQNQSKLNSFYQTIVQSPHVDWLSEYNTSTQSIGRGTFLTSYVDTGAPTSQSLTDPQIQQEIARLINGARVPAPDADTLYMVHFPAGVSIDMDGNRSCQQFCAYHGTFRINGQNVYYGVMPDFSGGCQSCGGTSDKLQNTTVVASHELIEAITDPAIGLANAQNDGSLLAWYDEENGEIGDVCQSEAGTVSGWRVQAEYSMQSGACIVSKAGSGGGEAPGCGHGVCLTGAPLLASCGSCTAKICQADPTCCSAAWTSSCAKKAVTLCGKQCQ